MATATERISSSLKTVGLEERTTHKAIENVDT